MMTENSDEVLEECDNLDDEELVLEGSELYLYLKGCSNDNVEVYKPVEGNSNEEPENSNAATLCDSKIVPKEMLDYINEILNSKLLMEEDASYLFNISSEFLPKETIMHNKKWACGVFLFQVLSSCIYLRYNKFKGPLLFIITGSTVIFISTLNRLLKRSFYHQKLNKLLTALQKTYFYIRKLTTSITEDDSVLATKEKTLFLKSTEQKILYDYVYKRKFSELVFMSSNVANALNQLVCATRRATLSLIDLRKTLGNKNEDYIALYNDEELGISLSSSDESYNLASLHSLKNIYLLMQSECLRVLGICFCQCHEYNDVINIFEIVSKYTSQCLSIQNVLKSTYEHRRYPSSEDGRPCKSMKKKSFAKYISFKTLDRTLNSVQMELKGLDEYLEANESNLENDETVISCINEIEMGLTMSLDTLKCIKEQFIGYQSNNKSILKTDQVNFSPENNSKVIVTNVNVGSSDFSVNGPDEVFLGFSDGVYDNITEDIDFINQQDPPPNLIRELKAALVRKREEFEQREISVLKSANDIEAYKSCSLEKSNLSSLQENEQKMLKDSLMESKNETLLTSNCSDFMPEPNESKLFLQKVDEMNSESSETSNDFGSSQKSIALAATARSKLWNNMKCTDYFEDEDSD